MADTYDTETSVFIREVVEVFYGEEMLKGVQVNTAIAEVTGQVLHAATAGRAFGFGGGWGSVFSWFRNPGSNDWPDCPQNGNGWGAAWITDPRVRSYWYRGGRYKLVGAFDSMIRATAARNFRSSMELAAGKAQDSEIAQYL